ncbi:MAG: membrane protein insertase YidC [Bacteroidia bacterium]|jgi:YidC/Oxa1 family membrane protein insertase
MDRNSIIGLGLIFIILVTFAYINQPSEDEIRENKRKQDSIALAVRVADTAIQALPVQGEAPDSLSPEAVLPDSLALATTFGTFSAFVSGSETFTTLENEDLKLILSNKGGRIYSVELKKFKRYDQSPLLLMEGDHNKFEYVFASRDNKAIQTGELYFTPLVSADAHTVTMQLQMADGSYFNQVYSLDPQGHGVKYRLDMKGMNGYISPTNNYLDLNISQRLQLQEKSMESERRTSTIYYRYKDDEPTYITETSDEKVDLKTPVQWISFKQQYFNSTIIADQKFENGNIETVTDENSAYIKTASASLTVPYTHADQETFGLMMYYGPNHYKTLSAMNTELERIIPMGWGIFRWVNKYIVINVFYFLGQYIGSFGLIILLLTILIKTVLFPLVYRSYLSTAKMRVLKPEIDEIKAKYGSDMQRLQQENMKLYKKAGVNPLGGCIPVLLQLPILVAMFQFFPSAFELRQQSFLWAEDLSTFDSIINLPFNIPAYGSHVSLFALLMTVSSIFYTIYNNQNTAGLTDQMKWISYFMPVVFLFMLNSYPAGLNYYYFLSNLVTIGQQLGIRRFVDDKKLHAEIQENKKKPVKKSRFEQKIEDMAKKRGVDPTKLKKK